MKFIMINVAFANQAEARMISDELLRRKLISCVQIQKIESKYWWRNQLVDDNEYLAIMKSKKDLFNEIVEVVERLHSYEVPEIACYEIEGNQKYLDWIKDTTK